MRNGKLLGILVKMSYGLLLTAIQGLLTFFSCIMPYAVIVSVVLKLCYKPYPLNWASTILLPPFIGIVSFGLHLTMRLFFDPRSLVIDKNDYDSLSTVIEEESFEEDDMLDDDFYDDIDRGE